MEVLAVFRSGKWIQYMPRAAMTCDPRITVPLRQKAASAYVTALQKGFSEERSHVLAEAIVFKNLHEELEYPRSLEQEIQSIMGREGKA
jgi:hypothetical protein